MLGKIQVTPGRANYTARRKDIHQCRECQGRRGLTPPEGHQTAEREIEAGQENICNNERRILGFGGMNVRGWNSSTS